MRRALLTGIVFAALAGTAAAQTARPPSGSSGSSIGIRGYAAIDFTSPAASKSFDAVFGSSQTTSFGGGAEIDVWQHLFVRFALTHAKRTGTRVFVDDTGQVFPLNIPLTVTMTPIEGAAGWRFATRSRFTPYIGGGIVSLGYQETPDFAQAGDVVNERYTGGEGFGGVDVAIAKGFFVGGEAQFRHIGVPDASSSVMHQFSETDIGGFTARVLIGFSTR